MSQSKTLVGDFHSGYIMFGAKKTDLIVTQCGLDGMFDSEIVEFELSCKLGKFRK